MTKAEVFEAVLALSGPDLFELEGLLEKAQVAELLRRRMAAEEHPGSLVDADEYLRELEARCS